MVLHAKITNIAHKIVTAHPFTIMRVRGCDQATKITCPLTPVCTSTLGILEKTLACLPVPEPPLASQGLGRHSVSLLLTLMVNILSSDHCSIYYNDSLLKI